MMINSSRPTETKFVETKNVLTMDDLYANNSLRAVHIVFASLFSSILTPVFSPAGLLEGSRVIPLRCTTRDALSFWLDQQLSQDDIQINRILPMLTYEMTSIQREEANQTNPLGSRFRGRILEEEGITGRRIGVPMSYKFGFKLNVWTNSIRNGMFILDQILPVFTPDVQIRIKENKELNIINDVKVVINDISMDDNYRDSFEKNRICSWTIGFNLWAHISPSPRAAKIISKVVIDMEDTVNNNLETYIYTGKEFGTDDIEKEIINGADEQN